MTSKKTDQIARKTDQLRGKKVLEAKEILRELGVDKERQNDRSAWTFLALANIKPNDNWSKARNPLLQTYIIMAFIRDQYGKDYKSNSRETIRKQTLHQFEQFLVITRNKDNPARATNSKDNNYSITDEVLGAIKYYPSDGWKKEVAKFRKKIPKLIREHEAKHAAHTVDFTLPNGKKVSLSPGAHNQLHAEIIAKFIPQFIGTENAEVLYLGDTGSSRKGEGGKLLHINVELFRELGLPALSHDKLPDLVIWDNRKKWLFLIEAVTSHGPISKKRYLELTEMFKGVEMGIVFVTAFPHVKEFRKNAADIAWETEVWIANEPDHMIHFNGDKFLGPPINF